jgi:hypothetical protein
MNIYNGPYISGFMRVDRNVIHLEDVLGIYADRGTPRKLGYWVKVKADNAKGVSKLYIEGLSIKERILFDAAGRFNQTIDRLFCEEDK